MRKINLIVDFVYLLLWTANNVPFARCTKPKNSNLSRGGKKKKKQISVNKSPLHYFGRDQINMNFSLNANNKRKSRACILIYCLVSYTRCRMLYVVYLHYIVATLYEFTWIWQNVIFCQNFIIYSGHLFYKIMSCNFMYKYLPI